MYIYRKKRESDSKFVNKSEKVVIFLLQNYKSSSPTCNGVYVSLNLKLMEGDRTDASTNLTVIQSETMNWKRPNALHRFTQQRLSAWKPVLTPVSAITTFALMSFVLIPVGLVTLNASNSVVEIVDRYDAECVPEAFKGNPLMYIKDNSVPKDCSRLLKVHKYMKAPIYVYYQLDNYHQNHRSHIITSHCKGYSTYDSFLFDKYVKSRSDKQLLLGLRSNDTSLCKPQESNDGHPIVPCGLIAWSLFNDTYAFVRGKTELRVERNNIAWKSERDHKFGKEVYPFNFQNGSLIGGRKLDKNLPLSDQEDLIIWMRTAVHPSFRKLYGVIEEDLDANDIIEVNLMNQYNTYSFGGRKKLVLTTSSWLGGKNNFLGVAYVFSGSCSVIISIIFFLLHLRNPRPYGDTGL